MSRSGQSQPLYLEVYDALKSMIISGELKPGQVVTEGQLATQLGVSRTPIREATKRLASERLLESSRAGLKVYRPTIDDIAQIYATRSCLEGFAGRLAALAVTPEAIRELNGILDRTEPMVRDLQGGQAAEANKQFHKLIRKIAANQQLDELIEDLSPIISLYRHYSLMFPENLRQSIIDHREIVRLLEHGKPDEVESAVRGHVLRAGFRVMTALSKIEQAELPADSPTVRLLSAYGRNCGVQTAVADEVVASGAHKVN